MIHFIDYYQKHKTEVEDLLSLPNVRVNLKVDGKPFQVLYNKETDELEYHGRSGDETHVGPLISDYDLLYSKPINDAIKYIEPRKNIFKKYKFLTFEVINEVLLLTAIIDKNDNFINDYSEIKKIAKELNTDVMPTLWEGNLSMTQQESILDALENNSIPTKDKFIAWVKELFGTYKDFPKTLIRRQNDFIEGIVFFFNQNGKIIEYKIVDPAYRTFMTDRKNSTSEEHINNQKYYGEIYHIMVAWLNNHIQHLDDNKLISLQLNFNNMMNDSKVFNKLMNLGANIAQNKSDSYFIQAERTIPDIQNGIKKHGDIYVQLLDTFIKMFFRKKIGQRYSKEVKDTINTITNKF